jgi:carboxyl-terminal processing protease
MTDSGRTVYGGGGINPDVVIPSLKGNKFQDALLQKYAFFNFAKHYTINHKVTQSFQVDDATMQEFRKYLDSQQIPYTEADLAENNDWVRSNIKAELFVNEFGSQEGLKVHAETDPAVQKALDLLPKAKELADNAKKTVAQKSNARITAPQDAAPAAANNNQ